MCVYRHVKWVWTLPTRRRRSVSVVTWETYWGEERGKLVPTHCRCCCCCCWPTSKPTYWSNSQKKMTCLTDFDLVFKIIHPLLKNNECSNKQSSCLYFKRCHNKFHLTWLDFSEHKIKLMSKLVIFYSVPPHRTGQKKKIHYMKKINSEALDWCFHAANYSSCCCSVMYWKWLRLGFFFLFFLPGSVYYIIQSSSSDHVPLTHNRFHLTVCTLII